MSDDKVWTPEKGPITRPDSFLLHADHMRQQKLVAEALGETRDYFRASELGMCPRKLYYALRGVKPRPFTTEEKFRFEMGNIWHKWLVETFFAPWFVIDGVEGIFNSPDVFNALMLGVPEGTEVEHVIEERDGEEQGKFKASFEHRGRRMNFHFRMDGIFVGIRHTDGSVEMWPKDKWVLLEAKSTTVWGVDKARKTKWAEANKLLMDWYPSYAKQVLIQQRCLNIPESRVCQGSRDLFKMIMDQHEPAHHGRGAHPAIQHKPIFYSSGVMESVLDDLAGILDAVESGTPPMPGCSGIRRGGDDSFVFNGCTYNPDEVGGWTAEVQCRGLAGEMMKVRDGSS